MHKEIKYWLHYCFLGMIWSIFFHLTLALIGIDINFIYRAINILCCFYIARLIFEEKIQLSFICKWYDMWIGMFWDSKKKWLYILPFPCIGFILKFKPTINNE